MTFNCHDLLFKNDISNIKPLGTLYNGSIQKCRFWGAGSIPAVLDILL